MTFPSICSGGVLLLLINGIFAPPAASSSTPPTTPAGNYRDSAVFYQLFYEEYADTLNLTLLPKHKLYISSLGVRDVENFSWLDPRTTDFSWWAQVESLRFLLPLIKSPDPVHKSLARSWFEEWCRTHQEGAAPNRAAWYQLAVAVRALVFVFYLKEEEMVPHGSREVIELLQREIKVHQKILGKHEGFSFNSNHGLMEAMGLLETTRVFPDAQAVDLGLNRLESIAVRSVSEHGLHMEHSCGYHFYFMNWLLDYIYYMTSQKWIQQYDIAALETIADKMKRAAYYMQDHGGNIPPIGDTDPVKVTDVISYNAPEQTAKFCFDTEAGFAVYKDSAGSPDKRYMVFNIQNTEPEMPYHYHNDALAVYFNYDGETLLGDQGRYEYGMSGRRIYFTSLAAHNTILPLSQLGLKARGGKSKLVSGPWWNERGGELSTGARLAYPGCRITRCITIPERGWPVVVDDTLAGSAPVVLLWNIGSDVTSMVENEKEGGGGTVHEWILHTSKNRKFLLSVAVNEPRARKKHSVEILKGSSKPFLGWYAQSYKQCVPSSVIEITLHPAGESSVKTRIQIIE